MESENERVTLKFYSDEREESKKEGEAARADQTFLIGYFYNLPIINYY